MLLGLPLAIGVVAQLLLVAHELVEVRQGPPHFALGLARLSAPSRGPQVLHYILQPIEHLLGARHVAGARHGFELFHHFLQLIARYGTRVAIRASLALRLPIGLPARHLCKKSIHCLAKRLRETGDFFGRRISLERVAQVSFRGAQVALCVARMAVLDLKRHGPQEFGDFHEIGAGARVCQARSSDAQSQVDAGCLAELFRLEHQGVEGASDPAALAWRQNEVPPLFDERAGQRVGKWALRQIDRDRRRRAFVPAFIAPNEPE